MSILYYSRESLWRFWELCTHLYFYWSTYNLSVSIHYYSREILRRSWELFTHLYFYWSTYRLSVSIHHYSRESLRRSWERKSGTEVYLKRPSVKMRSDSVKAASIEALLMLHLQIMSHKCKRMSPDHIGVTTVGSMNGIPTGIKPLTPGVWACGKTTRPAGLLTYWCYYYMQDNMNILI